MPLVKETRIVKKDTTVNWSKAKNFVPKSGEIIIYDETRYKIGDGKTKINDLPFLNKRYSYTLDGETVIIEKEE